MEERKRRGKVMFGLTRRDTELAYQLASADFKRKLHETTLGYIWSVLTPLLTFLTLYVVLSVFMNYKVKNYQLFILLGVMLFNFFSEATKDAMQSLSQKKDLVKKMKFPLHLIVISSVLTSAAYLIINLLVFLLFMLAFGIVPGLTAFYLLVPLLEMFLLVFGLGFGLCALYIRHGDTEYLWSFATTSLFWLTPIFYDYDLVPLQYVKLYMLNPLARIISTFRQVLLYDFIPLQHGLSGWKHELITLALCASIFAWGVWLFKKRSPRFAEML